MTALASGKTVTNMSPAKHTSGNKQRHGKATLKDLAAHLGLSQTTVSRVVSQSPAASRIPEETQKRILHAAAALNYQPNVFARGLRKRRSFTIGVMVPEISEGYSTSVLGGIEDALLQEGYFYFVVSHRHHPELLAGYPHLLLARAVEGIIAIDSPIEESLPVPIVAVSGHRHGNGAINIELDHQIAAQHALEHLYNLGHRKIAFIKGQSFSSDTEPRWNAICKIAAHLGLDVDSQLTVPLEGAEAGSEPGYIATRKLIEGGQAFTAIFAFNDVSAIGAITALHDAGIKVPHDVSVVGFDDIPSAAINNPGLTTVRQPLREMGHTAATTLLHAIHGNGKPAPGESITVLPTFVVRHSTRAVRK